MRNMEERERDGCWGRDWGGTWTSAMTLIEGSTLANSSIAMIAVVKDASEPPYSAGISIPIN